MLIVTAVLLLGLAAYAQWAIPQFTRGAANAWMTRLFLLGLGLAVGCAFVYMSDRPASDAIAMFVMGFALVHIPAALVLMLKSWRHERPS
jgi:hypothetical protein